YAEARGHTVLELAIAWLAAQPTVGSFIAGATHPGQLDANVRAAEWQMSPEQVSEVRLEETTPL
ncbi:MAG TPA: aldo/keto reductase, partial [Dehalococcoidia bacterium]|nr:aldo/keto reductase [Dehalococcoidia bacterium]